MSSPLEPIIALISVMSVLFLIIIAVFSLHIQPLIYSILRCNGGSTLFCEMDPLVSINDSSTDMPSIQYSTVLNVENTGTEQTRTDQIIAFPYFTTNSSSSASYLYISFEYTSSVGSDGTVITDDSVNLFNISTSDTGATSATAITVQTLNTNAVNDAMIADVLAYILRNKIGEYVFVDQYQNISNQLIYGLLYEGTDTPTITMTGTTDKSKSILGFISLNLNKDTFQTHNPTIENANDGYLDIKAQQNAIAKYNNVAGCADPGANFSTKSSAVVFNPAHGLYYPTTSNSVGSAPNPCTADGTNTSTTPCGYRYVNKVSNSSGYQTNKIHYPVKGGPGAGGDNPATYYVGYDNGNSNNLLTTKYTGYSDPTDVLTYPQLQNILFCGGSGTTTATKPWAKNNYDNGTTLPTTSSTSTDYNYATHPRLINNTSTDEHPSLPIVLGFS